MGEAYEPRSGCPINATIEVFGDGWSLLVLRDIVFGDRRYFESCRPAQKRIASARRDLFQEGRDVFPHGHVPGSGPSPTR
jgi:hypothetical protein